MISYLDIDNYKCFDRLKVGFGALTLLTGFNAGGKSSAVQPLLLLAQAQRRASTIGRLDLNGSLVRLGTVGDVIPAGSSRSEVSFTVSTGTETALWRYSARAGERYLSLLEHTTSSVEGEDLVAATSTSLLRLLSGLSCVSAVREGTADAYPLPDAVEDGQVDVGTDGRYAAYWYDQFVDDEVPESRRHPSEPATSLRKQVDAWFATLFPGAQVNVQQMPQVGLESLQFRMTDIGAWRRPANVGYGFTYVFPIVVALLAAREGQILIIDSPEAHLHPSAQSQMGRMLANFAAAGVQIVVETHSDHLLNGARLAVKSGELMPKDLVIHFFTGVSESGHGVVSPAIDQTGRLSDWPEGFFDQSEKDLAQLSGWE